MDIETLYINGITITKVLSEEFPLASAEEKLRRLSICSTCHNNLGELCSECLCLLVVRTAYLDLYCPIGAW